MGVDPTSTLLATGGSDGVAKVWDIAGGFCTHAFKGHAGVVSALAWNLPPAEAAPKSAKKGKKPQRVMHLLTGSVDGKVRVWDLNNQAELHKPVATLAGHDSVVRGIAVAERGDVVVTGSRDRTLVVWRLPSNAPSAAAWKQAETLSANEGIESVGFLPHPTTFWTGGSDGQLRLWDVSTSAIIAREPRSFNERLAAPQSDDEETRAITAVHLVSPAQGEAWLVSVHADQNIVVRSASATQPLNKVRQLIGFNDEIVDLALLASHGAVETHLAVATNSRALRVYELGSDETSAELLAGHTDIVLCVDRSPDMRLLASGAKDRTARIWAWVPTTRLSPSDKADADGDTGKRIRRPPHCSRNGRWRGRGGVGLRGRVRGARRVGRRDRIRPPRRQARCALRAVHRNRLARPHHQAVGPLPAHRPARIQRTHLGTAVAQVAPDAARARQGHQHRRCLAEQRHDRHGLAGPHRQALFSLLLLFRLGLLGARCTSCCAQGPQARGVGMSLLPR
ncbi:hypothetical protein L1887_48119 [Cichorium endivia]|nr:hypothetical protein L1887_48119 [Cichorium endivia]